jgi:simple sugar transport system ATP-binding protein
MVGREVLLEVERSTGKPGAVVLAVDDLVVDDERGLEAVRGLSLDVHAGEIVGIAGVDGNGQTELIQALSGMLPVKAGSIRLGDRDVTRASTHRRFRLGLGHIPEDRHRHGLVLDFSLAENSALHDYSEAPVSRLGWLNPRAMVERVRRFITLFDVRGGGPETPARSLSGGNQQKIVLAREIQADPRLLIAAQPTRGLDVGAIEFVHRRLVEQRDAGRGVLLLSFELSEVLSLSDRILVMYQGNVVLERLAGATDESELGLAMTGGRVEAAV